jgi:hypothetical protein
MEQENNYDIADRFFPRFVRAFIQLNKNIIDDDIAEKIKDKYNKGASLQDILFTIPLFTPGAFEQERIWKKFVNKLVELYSEIDKKSGQLEATQMNRKLKTNLRYTLDDGQSENLAKAKKKVPIIPVNPYSLKWIAERSLGLIEEGITKPQMDTIQRIFEYSHERGFRGKELVEEIKANIGLTTREYQAVLNRRELHRKLGMPEKKIKELTNKYQEKLMTARAKRIARTETITAQAHGRNTAWQIAQESGQLADVQRMWVAAPASPNPNRPCEICLELDGKTAKVGQPYESMFVGPLDHPPAHPNCRCTETLMRA